MKNFQNSVCLVVEASDFTDFFRQLEQAQLCCQLLELRIDALANISIEKLQQLADILTVKAIVTCRSKLHGGRFAGSVAEQNKLLQAANDSGFHYIDVDLSIADQIQINDKRCMKIISYHNFDMTPEIQDLKLVVQRMRELDGDIFKIATMCHALQDAMRLLKFLLAKPDDESMIVLGMGLEGKITRLLSPLLGGYLTFASSEDRMLSLGQIPYQALQSFYSGFEGLLK